MDDVAIARALRVLRLRRGWTQEDLARCARVSVTRISRIETARSGSVPLAVLRRVFGALDARGAFGVRLPNGDLERLMDARHAGMAEVLVRRITVLPPWSVESEATFSIYGERGSIDLLGWNATARAALVIEIKSELVDIGELLRQTDRYRRLAPDIVRSRGWKPRCIGVWVVVADTRTARRRLADHRSTLRSAFPDDGHAAQAWLHRPERHLRALSFLPIPAHVQGGRRARRRSCVKSSSLPAISADIAAPGKRDAS